MLAELGLGHADGRGRRWSAPRLRVGEDADLAPAGRPSGRVGQRLEAAAVHGVGGVGDELAEEDLALV
jgi:hypothetical protein